MAKMSNLQVFEKAAKGERVFSVLATNANAVRVGLARRGYKVKMRTNIADKRVVNIYILG